MVPRAIDCIDKSSDMDEKTSPAKGSWQSLAWGCVGRGVWVGVGVWVFVGVCVCV